MCVCVDGLTLIAYQPIKGYFIPEVHKLHSLYIYIYIFV